tara:strand:+ start:1661 stop:1960 length:300 start_codon:yes stop_codon:yes gene_type:complete
MTTAVRATIESFVSLKENNADHPPKGSLRVIQANAVSAKTYMTRRSAVFQLPTSGKSILPLYRRFRVSQRPTMGKKTSTTGTPHAIQVKKEISAPTFSL